MGRKRELSVFDAVEELDSQDRKADRKRRKETSSEKKKAVEAQSQTKIYNSLLEARILLQRALNKVNSVSNPKKIFFLPDIASKKSSFRETCDTLLEKLLQTRNQLSGSEGSNSEEYEGSLLPSSSSVANLHNCLQDEFENHRDEWKRILNKKHRDLRLHSGVTAKSNFRVMDSSFWEQVEATMEYEEIRQNNIKSTKSVLFDDSKVYQQLLKDFVTNSTNSTAGEDTSTETLRLSTKYKNNKNSKKEDVDRRASKGRKIRYKEIPKLVNFTFPLSRSNTSNLDREEYFRSLFGGAGVSSN